MPLLTRWYIKAAFLYLVIALLLSLLQFLDKFVSISPILLAAGPVYFHLFLVGWVTQLIFGVIYWMFPKYSLDNPHRSEKLAWITFWTLNIGLVLRVLGEPLVTLYPDGGIGWLLAVSALLQWLAGVCFVWNSWGRVRER